MDNLTTYQKYKYLYSMNKEHPNMEILFSNPREPYNSVLLDGTKLPRFEKMPENHTFDKGQKDAIDERYKYYKDYYALFERPKFKKTKKSNKRQSKSKSKTIKKRSSKTKTKSKTKSKTKI